MKLTGRGEKIMKHSQIPGSREGTRGRRRVNRKDTTKISKETNVEVADHTLLRYKKSKSAHLRG